MADKHPYMSGSAGLVQAVNHLRKSFPPEVTAETLKKLGIAPNNETYVINILRFINAVDEAGKKTAKASSVFSKHGDQEFHDAFSEMIETAYADLFSLHGKESWNLSDDKLISFFRGADHTSAIVGQRQAGTFQALAGLSGHGDLPTPKQGTTTRRSDQKNVNTAPRKAKTLLLINFATFLDGCQLNQWLSLLAIRNPRGHEVDIRDDPDTCLDHLAFASLLIRRLEQSGFD